MDYFIELFLSGLTRGSIYALIALGYTMVYGIIQLINFAHGEVYMIGAFVALIVSGVMTIYGFTGVSILILAALLAMIYAAAYGYTLEKIAYRPLRGAPRLSPLISAIGMSLFLQNYVLLSQTPDFLPFPELVPEFEFMEPVAHIIGSAELIILVVTAITRGDRNSVSMNPLKATPARPTGMVARMIIQPSRAFSVMALPGSREGKNSNRMAVTSRRK